MGANLTTTSIDWSTFETETVTITRRVASGGYPPTWSTTTVYSGTADFQIAGGAAVAFNATGPVDAIVATLILDTAPFPTVEPGDLVTVGGVEYVVENATTWTFVPEHMEIALKRGPGGYGQPKA